MQLMKTTAAAAAFAMAAVTYTPPASADSDDAFIAGAAGFAAGTLLGTATARPRYYAPRATYVAPGYVAPAPVYRTRAVYGARVPGRADWYAYCASKYRSFDPRTGTYLGYDGYRHPCR
jgi:hypothetical protein